MRWGVGFFAALVWAAPVQAAICDDLNFDNQSYTTCTVDLTQDVLLLFHADTKGQPLGNFAAVQDTLDIETLSFAMNAGMFDDNAAPIGLFIQGGVEKMAINTNPGPGNFHLLPNGILCIRAGRADVIETQQYIVVQPDCIDATQSGPMLVIDGALHPKFLPDSTSFKYRNGVGTTQDGKTAIFAISNEAVTFHAFARLFRDGLGLDQALFLDGGSVPQLHDPARGRSDRGRRMGPIIGVID